MSVRDVNDKKSRYRNENVKEKAEMRRNGEAEEQRNGGRRSGGTEERRNGETEKADLVRSGFRRGGVDLRGTEYNRGPRCKSDQREAGPSGFSGTSSSGTVNYLPDSHSLIGDWWWCVIFYVDASPGSWHSTFIHNNMISIKSPKGLYDYALATFSTPDGNLPKVDSYKYLGIEMQRNLPESRMTGGNELDFVKNQAKKGEKALNAIRPLLRNPDWPLPVKVALIRTLVMSVMIYGAEWVGYKQLHARPIQRVISKAMKLAMGNSSKSNAFDYMTLSYELGIQTVEEEQASLRARLSAKLQFTQGIKTWLKTLYDQPLVSRQRTWVSTTKIWEKTTLRGLNKYDGNPLRPWAAKGHEYEIHTRCNRYRLDAVDHMRDARNTVDKNGAPTADPPDGVHRYAHGLVPIHYDPVREWSMQIIETRDAQTKTPEEWLYIANIRDCVLECAMTVNRTVNWAFYNQWGFGATRGYLRASTAIPSLTKGITCRVRTARYIHLHDSIESLREQLYLRPDIVLEDNRDRNRQPDGLERVPLMRGIVIHLVGGVINYNFNVNYHIGFGALDELPQGQTSHGYTYVCQFLEEVLPCYVTALFGKRSPYFTNKDDVVSSYTYSEAGDHADQDNTDSLCSIEQPVDEGNL
ncbi:hypothetical protein PAXRUDRAFT_17386 [Paxillus rubicundulus Ve08.2h10]|uniref:Uncharacterized protein n=1 Tax=Paxillus rubicundulus Ve08.2h10 TaxID=930991 RepID=A0A0D0C377_9AGAM|nr:hypothetical protein PAXRUDRAFT_17386 [Paxillus rubicundulus Ve08.2h10]